MKVVVAQSRLQPTSFSWLLLSLFFKNTKYISVSEKANSKPAHLAHPLLKKNECYNLKHRFKIQAYFSNSQSAQYPIMSLT